MPPCRWAHSPVCVSISSTDLPPCQRRVFFSIFSSQWPEQYVAFRMCVCVCVHALSHVWLFSTPRLLCRWDSSGKNTGVSCNFLLQWIFLTQRQNLHLLHCRWNLYHWTVGKPWCMYVNGQILNFQNFCKIAMLRIAANGFEMEF